MQCMPWRKQRTARLPATAHSMPRQRSIANYGCPLPTVIAYQSKLATVVAKPRTAHLLQPGTRSHHSVVDVLQHRIHQVHHLRAVGARDSAVYRNKRSQVRGAPAQHPPGAPVWAVKKDSVNHQLATALLTYRHQCTAPTQCTHSDAAKHTKPWPACLVLQAVARCAARRRLPPRLPAVVPHRLQALLDPPQLQGVSMGLASQGLSGG